MYSKNAVIWRYVSMLLLTSLMLAIFLVNVLPAQAGASVLEIKWFSPESTMIDSDDNSVRYQVNGTVDPDRVHFKWNFSNGLDKPLTDKANPLLNQVTLRNKNSNEMVPLVKEIQDVIKQGNDLVVEAGDFKYTKQGGGSGGAEPDQLRLMELILKSTVLKPSTNYVIELGPGFSANNGYALGRTYSWEFTTAAAVTPADTVAPVWPDPCALKATDITPFSLTLNWPKATDNVGVTGYKVYRNGTELGSTDGSITTFNVVRLVPNTQYNFKVEAGDAAGNWSTNGPGATITTLEQESSVGPGESSYDTAAPTWPAGSALTATKTGQEAFLEWTAASDNIGVTGYKIYVDGVFQLRVEGSVTACRLTGLPPGEPHTFKVEAGDAAGNWSTDGPSATVGGSGDKPLNYIGAYLTVISGDSSTTGDSVDGSGSVPVRPTIKIVFDKNVVNDSVWGGNRHCFSMQDSAGKNVPLNVFNISDQVNFEERRHIFVSPLSDLSPGQIYKIIISPNLTSKNQNTLGDTTGNKGVTLTFTVAPAAESPVDKTGQPLEPGWYEVSITGDTGIMTILKGAGEWWNVDLSRAFESPVLCGKLVIPAEIAAGADKIATTLKVTFDSIEINIPMVNLSISEAVNNSFVIDIKKLTDDLPFQSATNETYLIAGSVFEIGFGLLGDGADKEQAITLVKPAGLKFAVDTGKLQPEQIEGLGLYLYDEPTRTWQYAGGLLKGRTFEGAVDKSVKAAVISYDKVFADMTGHWAAGDIGYMVRKRLANGVNAEQFAPDATITRAEFAVLTARILGLEPSDKNHFADVNDSDWFAGMVNAAAEEGLVRGYDGRFDPREKITREQIAVLLMNAYKLKGKTVDEPGNASGVFTDDAAISSWSHSSVYQAKQLGLIKGRPDGAFSPRDSATRAEAFVMVKRLLEKAA